MNNRTIGLIAVIVIIVLAVFLLWSNKESILGEPENNQQAENQTPSPSPTPATNPTPATPGATFKRVRIISPKAGEVWTRNKNYLVRWDTSSVTATEDAYVNLIPTSKPITDFYAGKYAGVEMFNSGIFPSAFPPEGSYSYTVPQSLKPGTYQIVVLVGRNCNTDTKVRCIFDTSDGLITIK